MAVIRNLCLQKTYNQVITKPTTKIVVLMTDLGLNVYSAFISHSFLKCQNQKIAVVFHACFCFLMLSITGFLILLFPICFFRHFTIPISIDYQCIISNQYNSQEKYHGLCVHRQPRRA